MKDYNKHVFICTGDDCTERGSSDRYADLVLAALESRHVPQGTFKVTRTQCLGACGFGPNIAIYPEGVWYYGVQPGDVAEIVEAHLLGEQPVARLLLHKQGETLPDEIVRDAVCGMIFPVSKAEAQFVHQERTYYFCGESCRAAFQDAPARFLGIAHGHSTHHAKGVRNAAVEASVLPQRPRSS